eukprot:11440752-Prorocentrum_lima.AAC.1
MGELSLKVSFADSAKFYKWTTIIAAIKKQPTLGMASDWISAIGGASTGVYLLYGHPDCDWEYTLAN